MFGSIGAFTGVTAMSTVNGQTVNYSAKLNADLNKYSIDHLPAGVYTVNFSVTAGYTVPASQAVTVVTGQVTSLTNIMAAFKGGTISGLLNPASGVTAIFATNTGASTPIRVSAVIDGSTGSFQLANLPPGTYTLNFTAATGYTGTAAINNLNVVNGKTTDVGTINFLKFNPGSISGKLTQTGVIQYVLAFRPNTSITYVGKLQADGTFS